MSQVPEKLRQAFCFNMKRLMCQKYGNKRGKGKLFAKDLGVSEQQLSPWLRGDRFPNADRQQQIADVLGITLDEMFQYMDAEIVPAESPASTGDIGGNVISTSGPVTLNIFVLKSRGQSPTSSPVLSIQIAGVAK